MMDLSPSPPYFLFSQTFRDPRPSNHSFRDSTSNCLIVRKFILASGRPLDLEGIELVSNVLQCRIALYLTIIEGSAFGRLPFLLLGFLRANNTVLSKGRFESFELRRRHVAASIFKTKSKAGGKSSGKLLFPKIWGYFWCVGLIFAGMNSTSNCLCKIRLNPRWEIWLPR